MAVGDFRIPQTLAVGDDIVPSDKVWTSTSQFQNRTKRMMKSPLILHVNHIWLPLVESLHKIIVGIRIRTFPAINVRNLIRNFLITNLTEVCNGVPEVHHALALKVSVGRNAASR